MYINTYTITLYQSKLKGRTFWRVSGKKIAVKLAKNCATIFNSCVLVYGAKYFHYMLYVKHLMFKGRKAYHIVFVTMNFCLYHSRYQAIATQVQRSQIWDGEYLQPTKTSSLSFCYFVLFSSFGRDIYGWAIRALPSSWGPKKIIKYKW